MPDSLRAGDTLLLQQALSGYAPTEWILTTEIVGPAADLGTFTAVDDGGDFVTTIQASTTAAWAAGRYTWQQYVTAGTERRTIATGSLEVLANLASVSTHDGRSHVKKVLDALEAVLEDRASQDTLAYTIGDRSLTRATRAELIAMHQRYLALYETETRNARLDLGLGHKGKIRTRFV